MKIFNDQVSILFVLPVIKYQLLIGLGSLLQRRDGEKCVAHIIRLARAVVVQHLQLDLEPLVVLVDVGVRDLYRLPVRVVVVHHGLRLGDQLVVAAGGEQHAQERVGLGEPVLARQVAPRHRQIQLAHASFTRIETLPFCDAYFSWPITVSQCPIVITTLIKCSTNKYFDTCNIYRVSVCGEL